MVPRITSIEVRNFFECDVEIALDPDSDSPLTIISGFRGEAKKAIANAIAFCFTGNLRFAGHLKQWVTDTSSASSDFPAGASGSVTIEVTDGPTEKTCRYSRTVHEITTEYGRERFIDPVVVETKTASDWTQTSPSIATAGVYPESALYFALLDHDSILTQSGVTPQSSPGHKEQWRDFVEAALTAGRRQAIARDIEVPGYYSDGDTLSHEIITRINTSLSHFERYNDYTVAASDGDLVIYQEISDQKTKAFPASGHWNLVSHLACFIAGDIMPSPPPLIGTDCFGRVDADIQSHLFQHINASDRQAILLLTEIEAERIHPSPDFQLTQTSGTYHIEQG